MKHPHLSGRVASDRYKQMFPASASGLLEKGLPWSQQGGEVVTAQSDAGPLPVIM